MRRLAGWTLLAAVCVAIAALATSRMVPVGPEAHGDAAEAPRSASGEGWAARVAWGRP